MKEPQSPDNIPVDLPSGKQFELILLPPREGKHKGYPAVRFAYEDLSVMDIPHVVSQLLDIHCAAVDGVLALAKKGKK